MEKLRMSSLLLFSSKQKTIIYLIIIGLIGLGIRLYYYPFDLPLTQDAIETYFLYANDIRYQGHLPTDWSPANNLWPAFLGLVFHMFSLENNMMFFMHIQKIFSIVFSILTLIPVYYLCKKFNDTRLSVLGAAFFILDPRIVQNSLFGITESLYFLLGIASFVLILNEKRKYVYISFVFVAIATLVRGEGIFILAAISVVYFIQFRRNKKRWLEYGILFGIFILILLPMITYRIDINGNDGIFLRAADALVVNITEKNSEISSVSLPTKIIYTMETTFKYLGWIMIPNFVLFVPLGFLFLIKKKDFQTFFILTASIIISLPAIGAYFAHVLETRYLYILFPMFSLMALLTIQKIIEKNQISKYIVLIVISGLIIGSFLYLELKIDDYAHEKEAYLIAQQISNQVQVVNEYSESEYLLAATINNQWPNMSDKFTKIKIIKINGINSMEELINDEQYRLTNIIVDNDENQPIFLQELMNNEKLYPYLVKQFDSNDFGYDYHVKMFKIDYSNLI